MTDSGNNGASSRDRSTFGVVFLTIFLDMVGFSVIFPLFPDMLDHYLKVEELRGGGMLIDFVNSIRGSGYSSDNTSFRIETVIFGGCLGTLFAVLQFLCAPLWGRWSDRVGRRRVLLVSVSGTVLGYFIWIFAGNFWVLVLSRLVGGIASGNLSVATAAIADVTPRSERAKGMAIVGIAFGLGFILGPAIGGFSLALDLGEDSSSNSFFGLNPFSVPAIGSFGLASLNLLWLFLRFKETLPEDKREKKNALRPGIFQLGKVENSAVKLSCLSYLFYMISFSGMEFTLTFLAVERFEYTPRDNALMFTFIGLTLIVAQGFFVRRLAGPLGERKLAFFGIFMGIIAFYLIAKSSSGDAGADFFVGLLLMSAGVAFISPTLTALTSLYSSESSQGFHLGVFRSSGSLARAVGPLLAGFVYFEFGSSVAYLGGACLLFIPALILVWVPQPSTD